MKKYLSLLVLLVVLFVPVLAQGQTPTPSYNPNSSTVKKTILKIGSKGSEVILWQGFLAKQKLMSSNLLTGNFGPITKVATQNFQSLAGLTADGVVGPGTLFFLENIMYPGLVLKDASQGTLVYLQDLYKQSKAAGVNKTKSTLKQVMTNLLSVTPLTQAPKTSNVSVVSTKSIAPAILSPKTSTQAIIPIGSTTQKSSYNTDTLKTFSSSTGAKIQYSCTFTSQYTQICLPLNTNNGTNNIASGVQSNTQSTNQSSSTSTQSSGQTSQLQGPQGGTGFTLLGNQVAAITSGSTNSQSSVGTANSSAPLFWYCTDPSCNTLSATTTPWWQSYTLAQNPEVANACVPLSGYDIKLKLTAEDIFSVYAYKENSQGKVTEMVPVCKDMKASVYGVPSWKTVESCKKFKLAENKHLAVVVADDGKIAEGWIGRLEIVGNIYFSQDFSWQQIVSKTALPKTFTDFPTSQIMQEMNGGTWAPTSVIGPMGIDPWGTFTDDTSLDDASWMKVEDPGQGKFSVFRLKNCGIATPASSVDLKVNDSDGATVDYNANIELSWNVANVTSCTASSTPTNTSWSGIKSINGGSVMVNNLTQNTTFNINCTSEAGPITDSVQVAVKPTVDLKVNNLNSVSVAHDSVVNVAWTSNAATSCVASDGTAEWQDLNNAAGQISTFGTFTTVPLPADETFIFNITCTGPGGSATDSVSVEVGATPSVLLNVNHTSITSGESVVLTWNPKFVTECNALADPTNNSWTGPKSITDGTATIAGLTADTTFTINCTGPFNEQVSASKTVTVTGGGGGQASVKVTSSKILVDLGSNNKTATISWTVTGISNLSTSCAKSGSWSGTINASTGNFITPQFSTPGNFTYTLTCNGIGSSVVVEAASAQTVKLVSDASSVSAGQPVKLTWGTAALPSGKKCKKTNTTDPALPPNSEASAILNNAWNNTSFSTNQTGSAFVYIPLANTTYTLTLTCEKDTSGGTLATSVSVSGVAASSDGAKVISATGNNAIGDTHVQFDIKWSELIKTNPAMTSASQLCVDIYKTSNNELLGNFCTVGTFPQYHGGVTFYGEASSSIPSQNFEVNGEVVTNGVELNSWSSGIPAELTLPNFLLIVY